MYQSKYYVYEHIRNDTGAVFYVGKGSRDRVTSKQRNIHWERVVEKYGYTHKIVARFDNEEDAFEEERRRIKYYGIRNLCNMTDGGEGRSGNRQTPETRRKISAKMKGVPKSKDTKIKMKLAQNNPVRKNHASILSKGRKMSQEAIEKIRIAAIRQHADKERSERRRMAYRKVVCKPIECVETGMVFDAIADAEKYFHNLGYSKECGKNIGAVLKGRRNMACGKTWRYADGN